MPPIKVKIGLLLEWQLLGIYIIGPSSCFNLHMWLIFLRNLDLTENRNRKSTIPMTSGNPDIGLFFFLITRRLVTLPHLLVHFCTWLTALGQTLVLLLVPWPGI